MLQVTKKNGKSRMINQHIFSYFLFFIRDSYNTKEHFCVVIIYLARNKMGKDREPLLATTSNTNIDEIDRESDKKQLIKR